MSESGKTDSGVSRSASMVGQVLGEYEIIEEIGRGGMGAVFRARQKSLDRVVALKVLSNSLMANETAVIRFRREAQATAKLHHPNIVPIYTQGQKDETHYYTMELVSGRSLHDIIYDIAAGTPNPNPHSAGKSGLGNSDDTVPFTPGSPPGADDFAAAETHVLMRPNAKKNPTPGTVASPSSANDRLSVYTPQYFQEIARQIRGVADALDYAHRNGVIHRDIKPHNLLVGDNGRLCLTDFGLARVLEQPGVTVTGEFIGSPLYMSPEQITGRTADINHRTDIYSLGATLYQWLTLLPPFPAESREQVIAKIISDDPIEPKVLNRHLPMDLETICLKALHKDPSRRYQSAAEMREDLDRFLAGGKIRARRPGLVAKTVKLLARKRVAAILIVGGVLTTLLVQQLWTQKRENVITQNAVTSHQQRAEAAIQEQAQLERQNQELESNAAQMAQLLTQVLLSKQLQAIQNEMRSAVDQVPVVSGLLTFGNAPGASLTDSQRIGAEFVSSIQNTVVSELDPSQRPDPDSTEGLYLSAVLASMGDTPNGEKAMDLLDKCLDADPDHYGARLLRAWIHCQAAQANLMMSDARHLIQLEPENPNGFAVRAVARTFRREYADSLADIQEATKLGGANSLLDLLQGMVQLRLNDPEAAHSTLTKALMINPQQVVALLRRAEALIQLDRYELAIVDLNQVLSIEPANAEALEFRGDCHRALGHHKEAIDDYLRADTVAKNIALSLKIAEALGDLQNLENSSQQDGTKSDRSGTPQSPSPSPVPNPAEMHEFLKQFLEGDIGRSSIQTLARTLKR